MRLLFILFLFISSTLPQRADAAFLKYADLLQLNISTRVFYIMGLYEGWTFTLGKEEGFKIVQCVDKAGLSDMERFTNILMNYVAQRPALQGEVTYGIMISYVKELCGKSQ
jgi:hypothetical protein